MTLEELGQELKKKRLERQVSLMDISAETRVNLKFLEAIERGNFAVLPQTYVRAMIREYAAFVGLNPSEMMEHYETARGEKHRPAAAPATPAGSPQPAALAGAFALAVSPLWRQLIFGGVLVVSIIVVVLLVRGGSDAPAGTRQTPEVAFDNVVRETEAATFKKDTQTAFVPKAVSAPVAVPTADSLRLEMVTRDTVWINVLIDGKRSEQYLLAPNRRRAFTAKEQFSVTMGNAGGAVFTLNGKELPPLGRRGAVIRNTVINQANLKPL